MTRAPAMHVEAGGRGKIADRLGRVADQLGSTRVTLGSAVDALGATGTGLCLLLFALAAQIPGIAPAFGAALGAVSLGLLLGHKEPYLPVRIRSWTLDHERLRSGLQRLAPAIGWLERWLQPRARGFLRGPATHVIGLAGLLNAVLIVLPIPFGNTAPAIATLILGLGLVVSDGLAVAAGLIATVVAFVLDAGLVVLGYTALLALIEGLF